MIRGHVFIVNEKTLPIHLEYQFVGVSSGERDTNIALLADMFRVKKGGFFGIFKASDNMVYNTTGSRAFSPNLSLKLIYRKKLYHTRSIKRVYWNG